MSRRAKWWLSALFVGAEVLTIAGLLWTGEGQQFMRKVYVRSWTYFTPNVPPPDRFLPKQR